MKIGAERNKLITLAAVSVILATTVYVQFFAPGQTAAPRRSPAAQTALRTPARQAQPPQARAQSFRPRLGSRNTAQELDPMTLDPTLRTDLLTSVREVPFEGVERNIFEFGQRRVEPPPPAAVVQQAQERLEELSKPPPAPPVAAAPKAPPIPLKYYGFAHRPGDTRRRAFLLDGEEVLIGVEGEVFKKRYKIVRIGVNSIVMEDLQFNDQQTLQLQQRS